MITIEMPQPIAQKDCVYYAIGDDTPVIIDAPHAAGRPDVADERTGEMAEYVADITGCGLIVSMIPRNQADLNRRCDFENYYSVIAHKQHRESLYRILSYKNLLDGNDQVRKPVLYISLHGMMGYSLPGRGAVDVEIGTRHGILCDDITSSWIACNLQYFLKRTVVVDKKFIGSSVLSTHIHGDGAGRRYVGYGLNLHVVQIEISRDLRFTKFNKAVDALIELVRLFRVFTSQITSNLEIHC